MAVTKLNRSEEITMNVKVHLLRDYAHFTESFFISYTQYTNHAECTAVSVSRKLVAPKSMRSLPYADAANQRRCLPA
jgi:hypothetical protein